MVIIFQYYKAMTKLSESEQLFVSDRQLAPPTHSHLIWAELKEEVMWPASSVEMEKWRTEQMEKKMSSKKRKEEKVRRKLRRKKINAQVEAESAKFEMKTECGKKCKT